MTREEAANRVVAECFWGDYTYSAAELLDHLSRNNRHIDRRRRTALANLTGEYELVPELSWRR